MPTLFDETNHAEIVQRIRRLRPDAQRQFGRMTAPQMVAHLSDQMRHTLGEATVKPIPGRLRNPLIRYLVIYWVPWPKGRVKGPPEAFVTKPTTWEADIAGLLALVDRFVAHGPAGEWPEHALFGRMTGKDWGVFCQKHFNHHLSQLECRKIVMGFFSSLFGSSKSEPPDRDKDPANTGRALRTMMLTTPPASIGIEPTAEFPRIYGILMDWPIDEIIATIFSTSTGTASLYTTSTFGVIGGETHEAVRSSALNFVRAADRFFDSSNATLEYPYPAADRVRFYFLTFDGVRVIDTDLASIENRTSEYAELFDLGQAVMTELRLIVE